MYSQAFVDQFSRRWCDILENYDEKAFRDICDKNLVLWTNYLGHAVEGEAAFSFATTAFTSIKGLRYRELRCTPTTRGWVQQHLVSSESPDGRILADIPACLIFTSSGGRIQRVEEYIDMNRVS